MEMLQRAGPASAPLGSALPQPLPGRPLPGLQPGARAGAGPAPWLRLSHRRWVRPGGWGRPGQPCQEPQLGLEAGPGRAEACPVSTQRLGLLRAARGGLKPHKAGAGQGQGQEQGQTGHEGNLLPAASLQPAGPVGRAGASQRCQPRQAWCCARFRPAAWGWGPGRPGRRGLGAVPALERARGQHGAGQVSARRPSRRLPSPALPLAAFLFPGRNRALLCMALARREHESASCLREGKGGVDTHHHRAGQASCSLCSRDGEGQGLGPGARGQPG